jgi:hypothetical protein
MALTLTALAADIFPAFSEPSSDLRLLLAPSRPPDLSPTSNDAVISFNALIFTQPLYETHQSYRYYFNDEMRTPFFPLVLTPPSNFLSRFSMRVKVEVAAATTEANDVRVKKKDSYTGGIA